MSSATRPRGGDAALRVLVVEVDPPHQHVLDRLRQLPAHRVQHLGLDRGMRRQEPAQQSAVAAAEVVDAGRLGAVVAEQVLHALRQHAELEPALAKRREVGRLAARAAAPRRSGRSATPGPALAEPELAHRAVHHLARHRPGRW